MICFQRILGVLPLFRHTTNRTTPIEVQQGISTVINDWELTMASLTFPHGIPSELWGTALTPKKWGTRDNANLNSLRLAAVSTFKLVKPNLLTQARRNPIPSGSPSILLLVKKTFLSKTCIPEFNSHSTNAPLSLPWISTTSQRRVHPAHSRRTT